MLPPGILGRNDVAPDGFVLDEEPRFIEQEYLERRKLLRIGDLIRRPVQDIEEKRLEHLGRIAPAGEIESLKPAERKRVLGIVEEEAVLTSLRPAVQPLLQLANDVAEARDCALLRLQHIHSLDSVPQPALFLEVKAVTLLITLDNAGRS